MLIEWIVFIIWISLSTIDHVSISFCQESTCYCRSSATALWDTLQLTPETQRVCMLELLGFFTLLLCLWKITKPSLPVCWVKPCGFYWLSSPVSLSLLNEKDKGEYLTFNNCKATDGFWGNDSFYLSPIKAQSSQDLPNETVTHLAQSLLSAPSCLVTSAGPLGLRLDAFSSVNSCLTHLCFLSASSHPNWVLVVLYSDPLSPRPDHKLVQGTRLFYFYILGAWYTGLKKHDTVTGLACYAEVYRSRLYTFAILCWAG